MAPWLAGVVWQHEMLLYLTSDLPDNKSCCELPCHVYCMLTPACSSQMLLVLDLPSRTANYELQLLQGHSWIFWMRCLPASSAAWALLIIGLAFYLETDIQWKSFILLSSLNFCCIAYCLLWSSWDTNLGRCFSKLKLRQSHHKTSLWQEVV